MVSNIEIVRRLQDAGHYRDSAEAQADYARYMSSDLVVVEPESLPYGGSFTGSERLEEFERLYRECWAKSDHEVTHYAEVGEHVACRVRFWATARPTGKNVEITVAEWWHVVDSKVVRIEIYYSDPNIVLRALGKPPRVPDEIAR